MSRVAKNPIMMPDGVSVSIDDRNVLIKGPKGELKYTLHAYTQLQQVDNTLVLNIVDHVEKRAAWMQAGTARAQINNRVLGVAFGYERRLKLVGVGYRSALEEQDGKTVLVLSLGLSHRVYFPVPDGVTVEVIGRQGEEIILRGIDKHLVSQAAANIRRYRKPDAYKGKGIRYIESRDYKAEVIILKEVKKK